MPAILSPESEEIWLSGKQPDAGQLEEMFVPFPAEKMAMHPVSPRVNVLPADDERVVRPVVSLDDEYLQ
jgi:putative SOS response-associated peptidase YedK